MNARQKLNMANIYGTLMISALVGIVFESWIVFLLVAGVLIMGSLYGGNIRPPSQFPR